MKRAPHAPSIRPAPQPPVHRYPLSTPRTRVRRLLVLARRVPVLRVPKHALHLQAAGGQQCGRWAAAAAAGHAALARSRPPQLPGLARPYLRLCDGVDLLIIKADPLPAGRLDQGHIVACAAGVGGQQGALRFRAQHSAAWQQHCASQPVAASQPGEWLQRRRPPRARACQRRAPWLGCAPMCTTTANSSYAESAGGVRLRRVRCGQVGGRQRAGSAPPAHEVQQRGWRCASKRYPQPHTCSRRRW